MTKGGEMDKSKAVLIQASSAYKIIEVVVMYTDGNSELYECENEVEMRELVSALMFGDKVYKFEVDMSNY